VATVTRAIKGQVIIQEGVCNDDIYFVREGEFRGKVVYKQTKRDDMQKQH
jgi:hypothetical protein